MALVLILLLVGVVAALTINVQTSIVLVQRHMQTRRLRSELRTSATDAAWCFLRDRVKPAATGAALPAQDAAVLPSGVETHVDVTDSTESFLGAIPFLGNKSISGKVYLLQATAGLSNTVEKVSCIYRRDKGGAIEVLGWDQNGA
ncbi:MAG: hypothetical protein WCN95_10785 [bacterium]